MDINNENNIRNYLEECDERYKKNKELELFLTNNFKKRMNRLQKLQNNNFLDIINLDEDEEEAQQKLDKSKINDINSNNYKKLNNKKNKNNHNNHLDESLNLIYNDNDSPLLYKKYSKYKIQNDEDVFKVYLYSINISFLNNNPIYGFIFPVDVGPNYKIKLYNRKIRKKFIAEIKKENELFIKCSDLNNIITFHLMFSLNLIKNKNLNLNLSKIIEKKYHEDNSTKKYYFVPLSKPFCNPIEIDYNKIYKTVNFLKGNYDNKIFPRINIDNYKYNNTIIIPKVIDSFKNYYICNEDNPTILYDLENIINENDDVYSFCDKYIGYNNPNKYQLKDILISYKNKYQDLYNNHFNAKDILEYLNYGNEEEQYKNKEYLIGIFEYRKGLLNNFPLNIKYYLVCKPANLNNLKIHSHFLYNKSVYDFNSIDEYNNISNDSNNTKIVNTNIISEDKSFIYLFNKYDVRFSELIPSIFSNFEELLKVNQFINDNIIKISFNDKILDTTEQTLIDYRNYIINKNYYFLKWAFTLEIYNKDYNNKIIKQIGSSLLKLIIITTIYHINEYVNKNQKTYELQFMKNIFYSKINLYQKAINSELYKYIINYPNNTNNYTFPIENKIKNNKYFNCSELIISQLIESYLGGIYMLTRNEYDCINFVKKLELFYIDENDYLFQQTAGKFAKNSMYENNLYKTIVEKSIDIIYKKFDTFNIFNYQTEITKLINNYTFKKDMNIKDIMQNYILNCELEDDKFSYEFNNLEYIEKYKIFYKFNDKNLFYRALTHITSELKYSKNYENIEFLGDAIIDIFITQSIFYIFEEYILKDPDDFYGGSNIINNFSFLNNQEKIQNNSKIFNSYYFNLIKSYLSSNYFICILSILLDLPYYLKFDKNNQYMKNIYDLFIDDNNINNILNTNLLNINYENIICPKFISDIFESLVGAIYLDSGLSNTYKFLQMIYGPSILYSCLYMTNIQTSIITNFYKECDTTLNITPKFNLASLSEIIYSDLNFDNNMIYKKVNIGNKYKDVQMGYSENAVKYNLSKNGLDFINKIKNDY